MNKSIATFAAMSALVACDPAVDRPDAGPLFVIDAGTKVLEAPKWTTAEIDLRTPYAVTTLRGTSDAKTVIISSPGITNPRPRSILPGGTFCADIGFGGPGTYVFEAQGLENALSSPRSESITIVYDPAAPDLPNATTCDGAHPAACLNAVEICGNNRDDDCNNLIDEADPVCATCTDDALEPNDEPSAPQIEPGQYTGLTLCPGDADFYGVFVNGGDTIDAQILFTHAEGNVDLVLYGIDRQTIVAQSASATNNEMLTHTATTSGVFMLSVFGAAQVENDYTLELDVR